MKIARFINPERSVTKFQAGAAVVTKPIKIKSSTIFVAMSSDAIGENDEEREDNSASTSSFALYMTS